MTLQRADHVSDPLSQWLRWFSPVRVMSINDLVRLLTRYSARMGSAHSAFGHYSQLPRKSLHCLGRK